MTTPFKGGSSITLQDYFVLKKKTTTHNNNKPHTELVKKIVIDKSLDQVQHMALVLGQM